MPQFHTGYDCHIKFPVESLWGEYRLNEFSYLADIAVLHLLLSVELIIVREIA